MNCKVFIGSSSEGKQIVNALQAAFKNNGVPYDILPWHQGVFGLSDTTVESLEKELDRVDFAVLVLTPDDQTTVRGETYKTPRDNVAFELGLFIGRLGRKKTIIVCEEGTKLPTDLYGVTVAYYQKNDGQKWTTIMNPIAFSIDEHITSILQDEMLENNLRVITERIVRRAQHDEAPNGVNMSAFELIPRMIELISEQDYLECYERTIIISPNENGTRFQIESNIIKTLFTNDDSYPGSVHWFVSEQNLNSLASERFVIDDIDMTEDRKNAREYVKRNKRNDAYAFGVRYAPIKYPNNQLVHKIEYDTISCRDSEGIYVHNNTFSMLTKQVEIDIQLGGPYAHKFALSVDNFTAFDYPHSQYSKDYAVKSISLTHVSLRYKNWTLPGSGYIALVRPRLENEKTTLI